MSSSLVRARGGFHELEHELLFVELRFCGVPRMFPSGGVHEALVVALRLALFGRVLRPKVAAARLVAIERVDAHQLTELEEVGHARGHLQRLVETLFAAGDA